MINVTCVENWIDKEQNSYGNFVIEPLEIGQGITLGNALRRTLLSDLTGYGISQIRVNNLKHEFSPIPGVREDVLELSLNLKQIVFKPSFLIEKEQKTKKFFGFLHGKGPLVITAAMFFLPKDYLTILNPHVYLCTLLENSEFSLEIGIEKGKGYKMSEERTKTAKLANFASTLFLDSTYMPIKLVNYKVKLISDTQGNLKESLRIEITTNGSLSAKRALQESLKVLLNLFSSVFLEKTFLEITTNFPKSSDVETLSKEEYL